MGDVTRRYFVMDKEKSAQFMERFDQLKKPFNDALKALVDEHGANDCWVSRSSFSGDRVIGLVYNTEPNEAKWLKVEKQRHEGKHLYVVTPNRRYKEGKHLARQLEEVNSMRGRTSNFSVWACQDLEMQCERITDRCMHHSVAGFVKGQVVVSVPVPYEGDEDKFPAVHADLVEVKKSEFIALTEE